MINNLISFSRLGRQALSRQPVDLKKLVVQVIGELSPDTTDRAVDRCIGDLSALGGDAAMLRMAQSNLIANAVKFTRPRQAAQIEIGS